MSTYRFKQRRGTTANLNASTDKPLDGEIIIEQCTNDNVKIKVGDGETNFAQLPYVAGTDYIGKLNQIENNAQVNVIETINVNGTELSVQDKEVNITVPTKTSDITNDSNFATESFVTTAVNNLIDSAPSALDTLNELAAALDDDPSFATTIATQIGNKVDKVNGKCLSTNDYDNTEKGLVASAEQTSNKVTSLSDSSTDTEYPSAKAVYDEIQNHEYDLPIASSNTLGGVKVGNYLSINEYGVLNADGIEPLTGVTAPTTQTIGSIGQRYVMTTSPYTEYTCVACPSTDSVTIADSIVASTVAIMKSIGISFSSVPSGKTNIFKGKVVSWINEYLATLSPVQTLEEWGADADNNFVYSNSLYIVPTIANKIKSFIDWFVTQYNITIGTEVTLVDSIITNDGVDFSTLQSVPSTHEIFDSEVNFIKEQAWDSSYNFKLVIDGVYTTGPSSWGKQSYVKIVVENGLVTSTKYSYSSGSQELSTTNYNDVLNNAHLVTTIKANATSITTATYTNNCKLSGTTLDNITTREGAINAILTDVSTNDLDIAATDSSAPSDYPYHWVSVGSSSGGSNNPGFLSMWNAATGLPMNEPSTVPYTYRAGDYYRVGNIDELDKRYTIHLVGSDADIYVMLDEEPETSITTPEEFLQYLNSEGYTNSNPYVAVTGKCYGNSILAIAGNATTLSIRYSGGSTGQVRITGYTLSNTLMAPVTHTISINSGSTSLIEATISIINKIDEPYNSISTLNTYLSRCGFSSPSNWYTNITGTYYNNGNSYEITGIGNGGWSTSAHIRYNNGGAIATAVISNTQFNISDTILTPTNYKPDGTTYTGVASTTLETDTIQYDWSYYFDGTQWITQIVGGTLRDVVVNNKSVVENKVAQFTVPAVINNLTSSSTSDALSASMGKSLQDQVTGLNQYGKFLSLWDSSIGRGIDCRETASYGYKVGDYFRVGAISQATKYDFHFYGATSGNITYNLHIFFDIPLETDLTSLNDLREYLNLKGYKDSSSMYTNVEGTIKLGSSTYNAVGVSYTYTNDQIYTYYAANGYVQYVALSTTSSSIEVETINTPIHTYLVHFASNTTPVLEGTLIIKSMNSQTITTVSNLYDYLYSHGYAGMSAAPNKNIKGTYQNGSTTSLLFAIKATNTRNNFTISTCNKPNKGSSFTDVDGSAWTIITTEQTELVNYKPSGDVYTSGISLTSETSEVKPGWIYYFDGVKWVTVPALPEVTSSDNGKVLTVVNGVWDKATASGGGSSVPLITIESSQIIAVNPVTIQFTDEQYTTLSSNHVVDIDDDGEIMRLWMVNDDENTLVHCCVYCQEAGLINAIYIRTNATSKQGVVTRTSVSSGGSSSGKADKVSSPTTNNLAKLTSDGNIADSNFAIEIVSEVGATDPSSALEVVSNKVAAWSATTTDNHYPSEKLVKDSLDAKVNLNFGTAHAGEFLVVGADGNVTTVTMNVWQGGSY